MVSCVIPTFKRSVTLTRAIDSVLRQTYKNVEVLVVDDNEKDTPDSLNVRSLVQSYTDPRVKLVTQPKHINGAEARNAGVRSSIGEYIAFLDDDDVWMPEKIEKQIKLLLNNPDCSGSSCLYSHYRNNDVVRSCPPYTGENLHKKIIGREVAVFTSTVLLKKDKLLESGLFNNSLRRHQDLQLLLDFTLHNKIVVLNEYLVKLFVDSNINRANSVNRLIEVKERFFEACKSHIDIYTGKERSCIYAAHYFEIVLAALREKNISVAFKYLGKIGFNLRAYILLHKRMQGRKIKVEINDK